MPLFDLPLDQLRTYRLSTPEPAAFDEFWTTTLAEARSHDLDLRVEEVPTGLRLVRTYDVTFAGFGGHPVKAWLTRPAGETAVRATVVEYNGYGGGRGLPHERLAWANAGYAHLFMDTRGQGSTWGAGGHTPDPVGSGPAGPGVMTRGVEDPRDHYYRRLFTDGVRAVDAARALPGLDPERVVVTGTSQGGGICLAVAGLVDGLLAVMPDVPFLCDFRRAVEITDRDPYGEITRYLAVHRGAQDTVLATLDHLDGVLHARRATAPALFSVALMDPICPPSTVYAAYNAYGERTGDDARPATDIVEYPFNQHEGGAAYQWVRQAEWLDTLV